MRHSIANPGGAAFAPTPERDMLAAGIDIIPDHKNVAGKRMKRGECPTCGVQTYQVSRLFGKNKPLTIEGRVYKGRCLACHPLEGYIRRPPPTIQQQMQQEKQMFIPRTLEVERDDDMDSVMSGITMDMRLVQGARNWNSNRNSYQNDFDSDDDDDGGAALPPPQRRRPDADDPYAGSRPNQAMRRSMPSYNQNMRKLPPIPADQPAPRFPYNTQHMLGKSEGSLNSGSGHGEAVAQKRLPGVGDGDPRNNDYDYPGSGAAYNAKPAPAYAGSNNPGLDADGYPNSKGGYGWDNQNDLLPPGGMDSIFQKPLAQQTKHHSQQTASTSEIQFDPARMGHAPNHPPMQTVREDEKLSPVPPQIKKPDTVQMSSYTSSGVSGRVSGPELQMPSYTSSTVSGPMLDTDDFPPYMGNKETQMPPRLEAQTSEPLHYSPGSPGNGFKKRTSEPVHYSPGSPGNGFIKRTSEPVHYSPGSPGNGFKTHNKSPLHPRLQTHQTAAASLMPRYDGKTSAIDPHRFDISQRSDSQSTIAPPLRAHDERGCPDDHMIHDPMGGMLLGHSSQRSPEEEIRNTGGFSANVAMSRPTEPNRELPKSNYTPANDRHTSPPRYPTIPSDLNNSPRSRSSQRQQEFENAQQRGALKNDNMYREEDQAAARIPGMERAVSSGQAMEPARAMKYQEEHSSSPMPEQPQRYPAAASGGAPSSHCVSDMIRQLSLEESSGKQAESLDRRKSQRNQTIHDIPVILHCLNLQEANTNLREKALRSLSEIIWKSGEKARDFILQHKATDTLVKAMWTDMENSEVQDAATHFLFALAASTDARASSDILSNEESFCDSLLFSMQMHASVQSIQLNGCGILACLAAASSNNNKISDGTLSGSLNLVLNAMGNHTGSREIQKAGIQALYLQCSMSVNAESNKRTLIESQLDNGSSGIDVVISAMETLQDDVLAMEWACRMCWGLTSSEDLVKAISATPMVLDQVMQVCRRHLASPHASGLVEASFGVIGNLAHIETKLADLEGAGVVAVITQGTRYHQNEYGVNIEACSAIANLSVSPSMKASIVKLGGVGAVVRALQSFSDSADFVGEAARAMACMSINSQESKEAMAMPEVISSIARANSQHMDTSIVRMMSSVLLASLTVGPAESDVVIDNGGVDVLVQALSSSLDEKVQEAACVAYRNLTCQLQDVEPLLQNGALGAIVKAMEFHESSVSIQTNSCSCIWNLAFKTQRDPGTLVGSDGIKCIVKAMQNQMESGELLELACGALWSLVDGSLDRMKDVVGNGAIDAVACAVVMHPNRTSTLEKACGVLSNLSCVGSLAEAIANAQGISIVVEAMRNNSSCISLLEIGCVVLRNIVFQFPHFAQEASAVVSTVINAMQDNLDAVGFQEEACNLLWVLAAEAESCQSKILALDGVAVLMKCLEHNSYVPEVGAAARGAFNELSRSA